MRPEQHRLPQIRFSKHIKQRYIREIDILLKKGAISKCQYKKGQILSSYFLIKKPGGKYRFILNLKKLNSFILTHHFKMEDYRNVQKLLSRDCYMAKIDLKDAYYLLPIDKRYKKFLRFQFGNELYEFNCLPFGLNIAPRIFTKLFKPITKFLRQQGCQLIIYLDDILILGKDFSSCSRYIDITLKTLSLLGFTINQKKSILNPTQKIDFLGFTFNSRRLCFSLPRKKINSVKEILQKILKIQTCRIRRFASLVGKLVSVSPTLTYGWLHVKPFEIVKQQALKKNKYNFNGKMIIPDTLKQEFHWWLNNINKAEKSIGPKPFCLEIFSDASLTGWGACCGSNESNGFWDRKESTQHINWLELRAAFHGLRCFATDRSDCNILLRIDNVTAIACINKMGSTQHTHLNNITRMIWDWCETRNIHIFASYISSKENIQADFLSRNKVFNTEFELNNEAFKKAVESFGIPEIDLFASKINAKCKNYVSWGPDPDCRCVDAFTITWDKFFFYAFPPFILIDKVLQKIQNERATGILIVPDWPTQSWYPLFLKLLVEEPIIFPPSKNLLSSPFRKTDSLHNSLSLVAGKLSGSFLRKKAYLNQPSRLC